MKSPKIGFKYLVMVLILIVIAAIENIFYTTIDPEIRTSLALRQFEDPTVQTDTLMRAYNRSSIFQTLYFIWMGILFCILYFDTKKANENEKNEKK